jgi:uncharacterized protein YkwD
MLRSMSGTIDRRALMLAAAAGVAAPVLARAQPGGERINAYLERLKGRLGDAGGGRFIAACEEALLSEHNQFRARNGLHSLTRQADLDEAARAHAADMIERGYFEHASPEGFTSTERVGLLARRFVGLAGENIVEVEGGPPSSAAELAELWRNSPGHRANMLRPTYTHVGFGVARRGDRTVAAAAFGQSYAELRQPLAFRIDRVGAVGELMGHAAPMVSGYALEPVGGGRLHGPFWVEDPAPHLELDGAYVIKPYLADPTTPRRFIIVDGPIVEAEG